MPKLVLNYCCCVACSVTLFSSKHCYLQKSCSATNADGIPTENVFAAKAASVPQPVLHDATNTEKTDECINIVYETPEAKPIQSRFVYESTTKRDGFTCLKIQSSSATSEPTTRDEDEILCEASPLANTDTCKEMNESIISASPCSTVNVGNDVSKVRRRPLGRSFLSSISDLKVPQNSVAKNHSKVSESKRNTAPPVPYEQRLKDSNDKPSETMDTNALAIKIFGHSLQDEIKGKDSSLAKRFAVKGVSPNPKRPLVARDDIENETTLQNSSAETADKKDTNARKPQSHPIWGLSKRPFNGRSRTTATTTIVGEKCRSPTDSSPKDSKDSASYSTDNDPVLAELLGTLSSASTAKSGEGGEQRSHDTRKVSSQKSVTRDNCVAKKRIDLSLESIREFSFELVFKTKITESVYA